MDRELLYVELKSGHSDCGPAWIGFANRSTSGKTIYFNDKAFQSCKGRGIGANYFDLETEEEYWISGVKENRSDRHWAGSGTIMVDRSALGAYLRAVGLDSLPTSGYKIVELQVGDVIQRINAQLNKEESQS